MGKLQEFQITLKDNKVVYSPGESISGTVKISTAQPIQCKGETFVSEILTSHAYGWHCVYLLLHAYLLSKLHLLLF